ncbi:periplasmic nitrate reductase, NapE protein [Xanthobacteraceae bacterium A53D]
MTKEQVELPSGDGSAGVPPATKRAEIMAFLILAVFIWPVIAVGIVGSYGFIVWMYQIVFGPPGPPGLPH